MASPANLFRARTGKKIWEPPKHTHNGLAVAGASAAREHAGLARGTCRASSCTLVWICTHRVSGDVASARLRSTRAQTLASAVGRACAEADAAQP